ncbi:MAG: peptidylprolyl isomerase PpiC [Plesiomonas sp.]|uniref:peptidylprolyl isomerase PpiC n=1 Tax=Plesiomonas sp. TaxID=2486279 RepID=UPI003F2F07A0
MANKAAAVHILVKTEKECIVLKQKLAAGADFGKLARQFSTCPSGKQGGDLGEFSKGQMVRAFDQVVFSAPLLEVMGPVKTQFGFHLIKVLYRN